ncbi:MAG: hypothetical protein LBP24_05290 [Coriobacteriales bacterium]|jgi:hypothetical protein|nr:hypothetical protein [Coriobacteriales bacterium]
MTEKRNSRFDRHRKQRGQTTWFRRLALALMVSAGIFTAVPSALPVLPVPLLDNPPALAFAAAYDTAASDPGASASATKLITPDETPRATTAGSAAVNDSAISATRQTDRAILNTVVICLTVTVVIGFLLTVKNRRKSNRHDEWWLSK